MILQLNDAQHLRFMGGFTQVTAARYCGVSLRSITRYENEKTPLWYWHLMRYRAGAIPGWDGFRFADGEVWTPANQRVLASEVEHVRWLVETLGNAERRVLHAGNGSHEKQLRLAYG